MVIDIDRRPRTGLDLVLLRVYYGVRQDAIARAWGCTRQHVGRVESARRPSPQTIAKYLAALVAAAEGKGAP